MELPFICRNKKCKCANVQHVRNSVGHQPELGQRNSKEAKELRNPSTKMTQY